METRYRLYKDGSAWCAVAPGHINIQTSPAGFGDTQTEAAQELYEQLTKQPPVMDDFLVACPRCNQNLEYGCDPDDCEDLMCPGPSMFD